MRKTFFRLLEEKMEHDETLFLLVADMGKGLVDNIQQKFPNRFLNVGIAEQNLIGVAAGLCNLGYRPLCYTAANFLIHRAFEQIRNDICIHNYPIILIGFTTGYDNGSSGPTHHCIDDIACVKSFSNISIYSPSTVESSRLCFEDIITNSKPSYIRISTEYSLSNENLSNLIDYIHYKEESTKLLVTHSTALRFCLDVLQEKQDINVLCIDKVFPLDTDKLLKILPNYNDVYVVEEHFPSGGLYNILCQFIVEYNITNIHLHKFAPKEEYSKFSGNSDYFAKVYGYDKNSIIRNIH